MSVLGMALVVLGSTETELDSTEGKQSDVGGNYDGGDGDCKKGYLQNS